MRYILFLISLLLFNQSIYAAHEPIHTLQNRIHHLRSSLNQDQNQQIQLEHQLKQAEIAMGNLALNLQKTQQQIKNEKLALSNSTKAQEKDSIELNSERENLAKQSRIIYSLGKQNYLKILLNQENSSLLERTTIYYSYVNRKRAELIAQFQQTLEQVTENKKTQENALQRLIQLENQQQKEQQAMQTMKQQREKLLHRINHEISNNNEQLKILLANKIALENVVKHLQKKYHYAFYKIFTLRHSGKLPWPTNGKITQPFGTSINRSQLKSTGVLISAPEGQPIYAIATGQVVYANWMSGYGLLLIIDHGNGLMSIYGRNHSLYKKVGDRVKPGDLIATVGNSGGYFQSGLYFALREQGKPVNPAQLCS